MEEKHLLSWFRHSDTTDHTMGDGYTPIKIKIRFN